MAKTIEQRRRVRALEAKRDKLLETKRRTIGDLAKIRVELKHERAK